MSNLFLLSISSDNKIEKYLKKDQDNFSSLLNNNILENNNDNEENYQEIIDNEEENKSLIEPEKRSTFNKIFGKMEAGSIRG
jgi:hypothetical protein